jgi:hypothetical protein
MRNYIRQSAAIAALGVVLAAFAATAFAARSSYSPTLSVSLAQATTTLSGTGDIAYTISGCGYDSSYGVVTVVVYSPVSAGWTGANPDSNGCISVSNFSTQGAGTYQVQAWQKTGRKSVEVASMSFSLS